jgi:hypothetical protein
MSTVQPMPPAVRRFLEELEIELKQRSGVSPEEALSDAREFALSELAALDRSGEGLDEDAVYDHLVERLGSPSDLAREYGDLAGPVPDRAGYAPGWRICCTRCGRSAPLAKIGGIRVAAKSCHKYTAGWCRQCGGLRFLRIIQDLDQTNLTEQLASGATPDDVRRKMHKPWLVLGAILVGTFLIMAVVGLTMAILTRLL